MAKIEVPAQRLIHPIDNPRREHRTLIISMVPFSEHEIIDHGQDVQRVLNRLRRNDPFLKELTLDLYSEFAHAAPLIVDSFDAISLNSSLEILNIEGDAVCLLSSKAKDRVTRALSLSTSLKDIRLTLDLQWLKVILDIVRATPNLEALTIRNLWTLSRPSIEDITAMAQVLRMDTKLRSLTMDSFYIDRDCGASFAKSFQGNQTITTLIMKHVAIWPSGAASFVKALPQDHSLETIVFQDNVYSYRFKDKAVLSVIKNLGHTPLKNLSLSSDEITQECCEKILQTLKENHEHSFTKLNVFPDDADSPWQNKIRHEIDLLTWNNCLQVEKDTWVDRFFEEDSPTNELLFRALERAKKVGNKRFSKAPDMLFYLIKESPDVIVQAIRDRR